MNFYFNSITLLFCATSIVDVRSDDEKYLIDFIYRFVFANEALCGDPFAEPQWLPAASKCFVNCDPTSYLCIAHTESNIQRCKSYPKACQAAIRKHLGWTTTVISVFRPPITTTSIPHMDVQTQNLSRVFRDEEMVSHADSMNVDRSAVEAAENIERDLMGFDATTSPSPPSNDLRPNEASMVVEVITSPPSGEYSWLEAPRVEGNGYSFEGTPGFNTDPLREQSRDSTDLAPEYERLEENPVGRTLSNSMIPQYGRSQMKQYEYALPQPPAPEPSPPAFFPFHLPASSMKPDIALPQPEKELVPKYINFLEAPEDLTNDVDLEPRRPREPQPPSSQPLLNNDYSSEVDNAALQKTERLIYDPLVQTTTPSWYIPPQRPYQNMLIVPSDTEVSLPEGSAIRGAVHDMRFQAGAARFEVIPPPAPLASAFSVGMAKGDSNMDPQRYNHHYPNRISRSKVFAEMPPDKARDLSQRCCEWSLSGFCDRNWRRVRKLCPKSCGSLVCDEIDGIKSCTRIVDVDIEECFQSSRISRYFGLRNAETEEEKRSIIDSIVMHKLKRKGHQRRVIFKQRR
ncbi:unnamed protein product [Haemonchus placei]|uniref:ShKT domain-containing protein n=1 Tax=Haemonchus placei TaxID=6290 RepID=A0A0N4W6G0_HAEPC|nr:unnamed protein product [Haemonchus placei]